MKGQGKLTKTAIAAAICGAMILPASSALAASKTERAIIGAMIGGVAGAALSKGDTTATTAGAAAGALIGVATDRDRYDRYDRHDRYGDYRPQPTYRKQRHRSRDRYGYEQPYSGRYDNREDSYRRW